jgi:hypothetical protein
VGDALASQMAFLHLPRKTGIKRCLASPPLKIAEARKSARASPAGRSCELSITDL